MTTSHIKHRIGHICLFLTTVLALGADTSSPESVVKAYLDATRWEDRLQCVKNPEQVRALMERQYAGVLFPSIYDPQSIKAETLKTSAPEWSRVYVNFKDINDRLVSKDFYVTRTTDGYRIDWEASLGFNPVTLIAYRATHLTTATVFRLVGKLDDYYNFDFRHSKDTHYSIRLRDYTGQDIYGYVEKTSQDGRLLFDLLSDGKEHKLIVKLKYPDSSQDASTTNIAEVIANEWYLP